MLENLKNYNMFAELVQTGKMTINTADITMYNWDSYYNGILSVMRDGIETEFVQSVKVDIVFGATGEHCRLALVDLYFNLIMWYMILRAGMPVTPEHLIFEKTVTKKTIKNFIDDKYIAPNLKRINLKEINNTIDEALHNMMDIDIFSMYLANTINLEDFISLMRANPRFKDLMHADLSGVPIEDVKDYGMELANESIDIILDSKKYMGFEHCLADSFRAMEGINPKQYKEFAINVGSKPDGQGGVHPAIVNASYLNGGLSNLLYQFIDSGSSRFAQIITKNKVGDSGNFARIVGLNNINTYLHEDETYDCHTKNFLQITLTTKEMFDMYIDRYYRYDPDGVEYLLTKADTDLIGRTLYFRSPETCASEARGHGICFRCYGDLAYINRNVKPGKMAAELVTSKTTQTRLSAKHLLETKIKKFRWNDTFKEFIEVEINILKINGESLYNEDLYIIIDPNDIHLENQDDFEKTEYIDEDDAGKMADADDLEADASYNEYVTKFFIGSDSTGELEEVTSEEGTAMYISITLNNLIRSVGIPTEDGKIRLNFTDIEDSTLFFIKIKNNELGKALTDMQNLLDKKSVTQTHTIHSLTQSIMEAAIEGGMGIMAVHFEVLIMNQIRNAASNLQKPDWDCPGVPYKILTLKQSLMDNPSVTISLLFQYLSRALYYPLTYKKTQSSFMDLFFSRRPQCLLSDTKDIISTEVKPKRICPVTRVHRRK